MGSRLAMGLVLLVVGVIAAIWGYNEMNSTGNEIADAVNLDTNNNGMIVMVGGIVVALIGLILSATRGSARAHRV